MRRARVQSLEPGEQRQVEHDRAVRDRGQQRTQVAEQLSGALTSVPEIAFAQAGRDTAVVRCMFGSP